MNRILYPFLLIIGILLLSTFSVIAQSKFEGKWNGVLKTQSIELALVFNIVQNDGLLTATMDSPDEKADGIPVKTITIKSDSLTIEIPAIGLIYKGKMIDDSSIDGIFTQYNKPFDMPLKKGANIKSLKPQEPQKPFPYHEEEVVFKNSEANIKLSGTLTIPNGKGPFPAIVLVSGSGPQNRDGYILGHKPFLVLSDFFTKNGYAVLRYDDRGFAKSEGNTENATTQDFATDALAAVQFLKQQSAINKKKIGIVGHSEGGLIATILAAHHYKEIGFAIVLAGSALSGDQIILQQQEAILKAQGFSDSIIQYNYTENKTVFDIIRSSKDSSDLNSKLNLYLSHSYKDGNLKHENNDSKEVAIEKYRKELTVPWLVNFVKYNPVKDLEMIRIPILALIGSKDLQVLSKNNIPVMNAAFAKAKNKKAKSEELPGLNHLFQEANTGLPEEYSKIEQIFAPFAMEVMLKWLQENVQKTK